MVEDLNVLKYHYAHGTKETSPPRFSTNSKGNASESLNNFEENFLFYW